MSLLNLFNRKTLAPAAKLWDSFWELAIDTPVTDLTPPGVYSASVRGNLLSLERDWILADSPASPYTPRPDHLEVVWLEGLPYWAGLTEADLAGLSRFVQGVGQLLEAQQTRLKWLGRGPVLFPDSRCANYPALDGTVEPLSKPGRLYPAYNLVALSATARLRRPRYNPHVHTLPEEMTHPPVVERWPTGPTRELLRNFVVEALIAEGVMAWAVPPGSVLTNKLTPTDYAGLLAVAAAPWFGKPVKPAQTSASRPDSPAALLTSQTEAARHIAVALSKLDFHFKK